jgi:hypothetical protein
MKRTRPTKTNREEGIQKRRDWLRLSGFARMHVWNSGGPIHAPHEKVLQLLIKPWVGDHESWTVYRHETDTRKAGKIVFKKWNYEADKARFLALGRKELPRDLDTELNVTETHLPVSGRWVRDLERAVSALSVPPITGTVQPLARDTNYQLSLWRSRQESEFSWTLPAPAAWRPISRLFSSLLQSFRQHSEGKPLVPVGHL